MSAQLLGRLMLWIPVMLLALAWLVFLFMLKPLWTVLLVAFICYMGLAIRLMTRPDREGPSRGRGVL